MKKDKKIETEPGENSNMGFDAIQLESDKIIHDQINKRKEENQALKKLLDNLNTSFPKQ